MSFQSKRLFIDNLPETFTKSDLEKKFNEYGNVSSVDIKQRKNAVDNQELHFAYVQLSIDRSSLNDCIQNFYNKEWNGHWITVQEAKENFLDRLKREREEAKLNGAPETTHTQSKETRNYFKRPHDTILTRETLENDFNDSIDTSSTQDEETQRSHAPILTTEILEENYNNEKNFICTPKDYIIKNNKNKTLPMILKIESAGKEPVGIIDKSKKAKSNLETDAEKKRVQSLANMRKEYQQKKLIIKNALAKVDGVCSNRIIFGNTDADYSERNGTVKDSEQLQEKTPLFTNDESDEEAYNFEIREQYEGKKGQKLLELQSKFKNDKRFIMDSRFLEEESGEENDCNEQESTIEHEKQKEFEILEGVLGHKVDKPTVTKHKMMVRFDPSAPQHAKYEVKYDEKPTTKRKREVEKVVREQSEVETKLPEVSKETFYKVTCDFQNTLEEKQEFSLANMFSQEIEKADEKEVFEEEPIEMKSKKFKERNPFKYDSSSDNESECDVNQTEDVETPSTANKKVWSEPFFFRENDYRFDEGHNFLKRLQTRDSSNFITTRRNLKEVIKAKVKNNIRNNRPFKRKLGGKKRIKVKKAFKH